MPLHDAVSKDLGADYLHMLAVILLCLLRNPVHVLFRSIGIVIDETAAEGIHLELAFFVQLLVGTGVMPGQKLVTGVIYARISVCKRILLEAQQFLFRLRKLRLYPFEQIDGGLFGKHAVRLAVLVHMDTFRSPLVHGVFIDVVGLHGLGIHPHHVTAAALVNQGLVRTNLIQLLGIQLIQQIIGPARTHEVGFIRIFPDILFQNGQVILRCLAFCQVGPAEHDVAGKSGMAVGFQKSRINGIASVVQDLGIVSLQFHGRLLASDINDFPVGHRYGLGIGLECIHRDDIPQNDLLCFHNNVFKSIVLNRSLSCRQNRHRWACCS